MNKSSGIYNLIDKENIERSIQKVAGSNIEYNTYSSPKGIKELREKVAEMLKEIWNFEISYKDMLITTGSQQSINLAVYAFLKAGDTVLIEEPTYYGAIEIFKKLDINVYSVSLEKDGLNINELKEKIKKYSPKMIYVVPTFNNPTGIAWSMEKREQFLDAVNKNNILVIEDDPYSLINYTNENYETLYKLNKGKNVIYLGTFSKIISPSINVGYILGLENVINKIYEFKESFDLCTSVFIQYVVLEYLNSNNLKEITSKKIKIYRELLNKSLKEILAKYKEEILEYTIPSGGLFYLVKFKHNVDMNTFMSGNKYYLSDGHLNETRINICSYM